MSYLLRILSEVHHLEIHVTVVYAYYCEASKIIICWVTTLMTMRYNSYFVHKHLLQRDFIRQPSSIFQVCLIEKSLCHFSQHMFILFTWMLKFLWLASHWCPRIFSLFFKSSLVGNRTTRGEANFLRKHLGLSMIISTIKPRKALSYWGAWWQPHKNLEHPLVELRKLLHHEGEGHIYHLHMGQYLFYKLKDLENDGHNINHNLGYKCHVLKLH